MRLLISVLVAGGCLLGSAVRAASPADVWPVRVPDATGAKVPDDAAGTLAPELGPAIRFQQTFYQILARVPAGSWLPSMRGFVDAKENDPVTAGVREVAKAWLARAEMEQIATALDTYYTTNVKYPATLAEIEKTLPAEVKKDPWGEAWVYRTHAPHGFANQAGQRYQIGPKRFPELGTVREATGQRKDVKLPAWKVTLQTVASNRALEFREGGKVVGVITAGGKIGEYSLLYVGEGWALMAGTDQLFAISF